MDSGQAIKDNSIKVMNMFVSIYLLTMLSVDRYISIVRSSEVDGNLVVHFLISWASE